MGSVSKMGQRRPCRPCPDNIIVPYSASTINAHLRVSSSNSGSCIVNAGTLVCQRQKLPFARHTSQGIKKRGPYSASDVRASYTQAANRMFVNDVQLAGACVVGRLMARSEQALESFELWQLHGAPSLGQSISDNG